MIATGTNITQASVAHPATTTGRSNETPPNKVPSARSAADHSDRYVPRPLEMNQTHDNEEIPHM